MRFGFGFELKNFRVAFSFITPERIFPFAVFSDTFSFQTFFFGAFVDLAAFKDRAMPRIEFPVRTLTPNSSSKLFIHQFRIDNLRVAIVPSQSKNHRY